MINKSIYNLQGKHSFSLDDFVEMPVSTAEYAYRILPR